MTVFATSFASVTTEPTWTGAACNDDSVMGEMSFGLLSFNFTFADLYILSKKICYLSNFL